MLEVSSYLADVKSVTNEKRLREFLGTYFVASSEYSDTVISQMKAVAPHRLKNPNYIIYYARTILGAAEYGFDKADGHLHRRKEEYKRELTDPRHLLDFAGYLAHINKQAYTFKMSSVGTAERSDQPLTPEQIEMVWSTYRVPFNGNVHFDLPIEPVTTGRISQKVPVLSPDIGHHNAVADLKFDSTAAENMPKDLFTQDLLPGLRVIYGNLADIDSVFLDRREKWGSDNAEHKSIIEKIKRFFPLMT